MRTNRHRVVATRPEPDERPAAEPAPDKTAAPEGERRRKLGVRFG